jgi:hypothetical protein
MDGLMNHAVGLCSPQATEYPYSKSPALRRSRRDKSTAVSRLISPDMFWPVSAGKCESQSEGERLDYARLGKAIGTHMQNLGKYHYDNAPTGLCLKRPPKL